MEVKLNTNANPIGPVSAGQPKKNEVKVEGGGAAFDKTEALNQMLRQSADSRTEEVAKAREKMALTPYPPPEAIRKISALLAMHIKA